MLKFPKDTKITTSSLFYVSVFRDIIIKHWCGLVPGNYKVTLNNEICIGKTIEILVQTRFKDINILACICTDDQIS